MSVFNIDEQSADQTLKISPRSYGPDEDILEDIRKESDGD
jgi:hypothetical protein